MHMIARGLRENRVFLVTSILILLFFSLHSLRRTLRLMIRFPLP